jgi:hypothetical protein
MQLAPVPTCSAVLLGIPLALTEQLQAGAVEHEVSGAVMPGSARLTIGESATTPGQGCVVRDGQLEPEQPQQAAGERFGLTKREVEDEPRRQHQLGRQVRVERLPTGCRPTRGLPIPPAPPRRARKLHPRAASARPCWPASSSPDSALGMR